MVKALKALVIGMGILIAIGVAALGYGIYQKAKELDLGPKKTVSQGGFNEKSLPIPPGCHIAEMKPDGPRLYVRLSSTHGSILSSIPSSNQGQDRQCATILVIDTATGKVTGSLKAAP